MSRLQARIFTLYTSFNCRLSQTVSSESELIPSAFSLSNKFRKKVQYLKLSLRGSQRLISLVIVRILRPYLCKVGSEPELNGKEYRSPSSFGCHFFLSCCSSRPVYPAEFQPPHLFQVVHLQEACAVLLSTCLGIRRTFV